MNFYRKKKLAERGNIEKMNDPDAKWHDPYKKRKPSDGTGTSLVQMGDEDSSGSVGGSRVRGKTFPEVGSDDDYDLQRERDIPTSRHMFIGGEDEPGQSPIGDGANDDRFVDPVDRTVDTYKGRSPVGPHNMQTFRNVVQRTSKNLKGV